ncbi:hypothetical protein AAIH70_11760 [Neorhizobium sp. BT27B]|uniref:hypothetical protein n=1 Tax=Neorhizobium sp. BT27B TaxID=3142625 RepID=UPI003D2AF268
MAVRFLANAGRIIMSKAGYDASPSLPDQFKLFDSNWMATGLLIATLRKPWTGANPEILLFPHALHYAPATDFTGAGYTTSTALVVENPNGRNSGEIVARIYAVSI